MSLFAYANLSDEQLARVRELESELGIRILALREYRPEYAELDEDAVYKLLELERDLRVVAVAIE